MLDLAAATSPEAKAAIARGAVAVLAVGAQEQHGSHLPLATDTILAQGVARRVCAEIDGLLLPPIAYGDAWNNEGFAGTLSLSPDTLRAIVLDIGRGASPRGREGAGGPSTGIRQSRADRARRARAEAGQRISRPASRLSRPRADRDGGL